MSSRAPALAADLASAPTAAPDPAGLDPNLESALLAGLSDAGDDLSEGPEEGAPALDLDDGRAPTPAPGEETPGPAAPPAVGPAAPAGAVSAGREDESPTKPVSLAPSRRSSDPDPVSGEEEDSIDRPADEEDLLDEPGFAESGDRLPEAMRTEAADGDLPLFDPQSVRSETAGSGLEERLDLKLLAGLDPEPAAVAGREAGADLEHALRAGLDAGLDPNPRPVRVPPPAFGLEAEPDLVGEPTPGEAEDGLLSWRDEEEPEKEAADVFCLAAAMDEEEDAPFLPPASEDARADAGPGEDGPVLGGVAELRDALAPGDDPVAVPDPIREAAPPHEAFDVQPEGGVVAATEREAGAGPDPVAEADAGIDTGHPAADPAPPTPFAAALVPEPEAPAPFAFATDPESESALRAGLSHHPLPQVWPGDLRTAVATLGAGHAPRLLFVDLDGTPYPAGAIHELASVCEVGTEVIAFGSNPTARFSREILLAGVSDYLVKPLTADAVREAAGRVGAATGAVATAADPGGWSVGFAGTGGSGSTTLAAATALLAAERGRYVSVLDLDRTFPALAFLLDVEPASGLVEVLSTAARASLHPEMVDAMRAKRSDRISVYGYPWNAVPAPPPPAWAVCELLQELQRRSHLVIVDGLDDPATRLALLAITDGRVLVVEPTGTGAPVGARLLERLGPMAGPERAALVVQNHTRAGKAKAGAKVLREAGVEPAPEVVVPFESTLSALTDRGWPNDRLPKPLRKPLDALVDRVLAGERATSGADRVGTEAETGAAAIRAAA